MKTASKVFIWIGMILQFYLIYPIVVGILALKKIESATSYKDLKTLGILTTLFCSLLGGIFMLSINDDELQKTTNNGGKMMEKKTLSNSVNIKNDILYTFNILNLVTIFIFSIANLVLNVIFGIIYEFCDIIILMPFLAFIQLLLLIAILCNNLGKQSILKKSNIILLSIFSLLCIPMIPFTVIIYEFEYFIVFSFSIVEFIMSIFLIIINYKSNTISTVNLLSIQTNAKKVNVTEEDLINAKKYFDKGLINEQEYSMMKQRIINK